MKCTISIAEAYERQKQLQLFLSFNPRVRVDRIVKLVDAGSASVYRVFYRNASLSLNKQGWDEIFAQSPSLIKKIWRRITA